MVECGCRVSGCRMYHQPKSQQTLFCASKKEKTETADCSQQQREKYLVHSALDGRGAKALGPNLLNCGLRS